MFNNWNRMAMKALSGQNSQPSTFARWTQTAKSVVAMFNDAKDVKLDGVICKRIHMTSVK